MAADPGAATAVGDQGSPRVDDRRAIDGTLCRAETGIAWRDPPERPGPWKTVYTRFRRWSPDGAPTMLVRKVRVVAEAIDELDREVSVGSRIVRAHQHAAGARQADTAATTRSRTGRQRILQRARRTR